MAKNINELENPAKRLYTLLSKAKKQQGKKSTGEVWSSVLGNKVSY